MNWFFVRLWIKSAVHRSAVDPKPVKFVCELAFFPSGDQNNAKYGNKQKDKNKNKNKKNKDKREKLVVRMSGYWRLVTESVSYLTDTLSFATVCKTIGSALSTTCSSNAMK